MAAKDTCRVRFLSMNWFIYMTRSADGSLYAESGHTRSTACIWEAEIKKLNRLQKIALVEARACA